MALVDIRVTARIPALWTRAATVVIIIVVVLVWAPRAGAPLAFGGWLGSWLLAGRPPTALPSAAEKGDDNGQ
jgi:hypothetical protein